MWQSDIFTFLLRRHERLYLAAFMDDHSRFIVSYTLAHHQKSELVLEAFERGVAAWGEPREVLTDQGRQYTAWRGETDFERMLYQHGIRHVKSRPQHPQTLGKVERFWKTLWDEFLSRTVFADFADCERRLGLFVQAYNFQRPHQALGGLVPADRFFRAAPHVRAAIEKSVAANAMRLAHEKPAQKPFYLVGRLGDRDLSIAAHGGGLHVRVGDEEPTRIELPRREPGAASRRPPRLWRLPSTTYAYFAVSWARMRFGTRTQSSRGARPRKSRRRPRLPWSASGALPARASSSRSRASCAASTRWTAGTLPCRVTCSWPRTLVCHSGRPSIL